MTVVSTEPRQTVPNGGSGQWAAPLMVVLSFAALIIAWHLSATLWPSRSFPAPLLVLQTFLSETASGDLPYHLAITLWRVAASFVLA
ncbi:MAG: ABC transporter permease, partial [Phyllobacterium sp.]